ncbi:MAG TPA: FG-GAP-like repeat-containing protein [Pyrinomonadaceae bacterium]
MKKSQPAKKPGPSDLFVEPKPAQTQEGGGATGQVRPVSAKAVRFAESLPLRDMPSPAARRNGSILSPGEGQGQEINEQNAEDIRRAIAGAERSIDPVVQTNLKPQANGPESPAVMPGPALTFEGMSSQDNLNASGGSTVMPPDTNGDVGPNHYVQTTNFLFNVYNKTGTALLPGGRKYSQLFGPVGGICSTRNDGDPVVLYDQLADRWMISQFCVGTDPFTHQLIAYSKTPDPTGAYYLYDFQMPDIHFPDYPHFGIWHDALYMTGNVFANVAATAYYAGGSYAFDRTRMLAGDPAASMIYIDTSTIEPGLFGQLPADADGFQGPPANLPELICEFRATEFGDAFDAIRCYEFRPNFDNPASTTYTVLPDFATAPFDPLQPNGRVDIEQPSPATAAHNLDSVGNRLMHRFTYRNLGTSAAPVNNYATIWTVNVSGVSPTTASNYQAGSRWTEFRRDPTTNAFSIRDQGTYVNGPISGTTGENDWLGSIANDNQGNLAIGFSGSSTTLLPTIKWAGRTGAPSGTLDQGEATMFASTGAQLATNSRWGDYSSINVDPTDDCTFWATNEYRLLANQSAAGTFPFLWNTRIGNFKFPTCTTSPRGSISGTVKDANGNPIANAIVKTSNGYFRMTDAGGAYSIGTAGPDSYTMTAYKRGVGVGPSTVAGVVVTNGNNTVQDFVLAPAADVALGAVTITEGQFSNGNGHVDPGETGNIVVTFNDPSAIPATGVTATLMVKNPTAGVNIAQPPTRNLGTIPGNSSVSNAADPFRFTLAAQTPIATTIEFVLKVDFGGGASPTFLYFSYFVGINNPTFAIIPNTTLDTTPPAVPAGAISATTGTQTGRLSRSGVASGCGTPKANPGIIAGDTTARQYDAYTYTNSSPVDILCVTVSVNQTGTALYTAAYGNGGFVPANPATNFIGDAGSSSATMSYSFDVGPLSNFTIVVHDVTPPAGIGQAYNVNISTVAYNLPPVRRRSDFDVDLKSDIAVWRPADGNWYYRNSSTGIIQSTFWGAATDKPVPGDYDGDGKTDFAVYRPSENNWYIRKSFDGTGTVRGFGAAGDTPVPSDYDGDGKTDIAVFRPSEGKWYILNSYTNTLTIQAWGDPTDKAVPADYDGDGKSDLAVFRPSTGNWHVRRSTGGQTVTNWGISTDTLVPHDYDGDRKTDVAIFRSSEGNWYIRNSATNTITIRNWGNSTDTPVPGDYDGDNKADIAVWRPSEGNWYIINSSGSPAATILNLGNPGDRPVQLDYIPNP